MGIIGKYLLKPLGYKVVNLNSEISQYDPNFIKLYNQCKPFTMTSIERMYALYNAVHYVIKNDIKGDFVECGVWRGGSSMLIALTLKELNISDRKIMLYDTFEGMSEPTEFDLSFKGDKADDLLNKNTHNKETSVWCFAGIDDVTNNMKSTGFNLDNISFIKGKVEDTIPKTISDSIAILRLDTDWYESTAHELKHLYPILSTSGVLIIDDYGHWEGAKKAVDEYFANSQILLNRIDYTGRISIKTN